MERYGKIMNIVIHKKVHRAHRAVGAWLGRVVTYCGIETVQLKSFWRITGELVTCKTCLRAMEAEQKKEVRNESNLAGPSE